MNKPLIVNGNQYKCKYVTTEQGSQEVISSSDSPSDAYNKAKAKGCDDPVLIYVPDEDDLYPFNRSNLKEFSVDVKIKETSWKQVKIDKPIP